MIETLLNNRYQILQVLGKGGFGETFLAVDTHMPSARKCVIKQLKPAIQVSTIPEGLQKRFKREAAILEELGENNSQIPRLYAYFSENGDFYLVQEWIEGMTLTQKHQQQGNFSQEEVIKFLRELLPVIDYIHTHHIIHRDIKPDNIIWRESDSKPVLIDFGVMKEAVATAVAPNGKTLYSLVLGTPGFMSSEQGVGRPAYSSDLYSLGVTAIFLLTGIHPRNLETDPHTEELLWRQSIPDLHSNLAMVLDRAVRFHPRDRFASAKEMLAALQICTDKTTGATLPINRRAKLTQKKFTQTFVRPQEQTTPKPSKPLSPPRASVTSQQPLFTTPQNPKHYASKQWILGILLIGGTTVGIVTLAIQSFFWESSFSSAPSTDIKPSPTPSTEIKSSPKPLFPPNATPQPKVTQTSEPIPTPKPEPKATQTSEPPSTPKSDRIPVFSTGVSQQEIIQTLGQPTSIRKGVWGNSRAVLYKNFVPQQVDLGYIFDVNTEKLKQTEVSFAQSIELETMQKSLNGMLEGKTTASVERALEQIYYRQSRRYSFTTGNLEGTIERNDRDRIYIGVWEADFH
jgi:serine/threonine protein kinase, bacterial